LGISQALCRVPTEIGMTNVNTVWSTSEVTDSVPRCA
jgi:hypothetical protein